MTMTWLLKRLESLLRGISYSSLRGILTKARWTFTADVKIPSATWFRHIGPCLARYFCRLDH